MEFFKKLFKGKEKPSVFSDDELIEAGACPNCWGIYEYDDQFIEYFKDQTKANINNDKSNRKAFIQQFVETNITGIRLKKDGEKQVCPKCSKGYKILAE